VALLTTFDRYLFLSKRAQPTAFGLHLYILEECDFSGKIHRFDLF